ncbi:MAG: hypothetical protein HRU25_02455 [Psychrobium sp.]|nr:hypothetical protein [Psychrobium sp.]
MNIFKHLELGSAILIIPYIIVFKTTDYLWQEPYFPPVALAVLLWLGYNVYQSQKRVFG